MKGTPQGHPSPCCVFWGWTSPHGSDPTERDRFGVRSDRGQVLEQPTDLHRAAAARSGQRADMSGASKRMFALVVG